MLHEHIYYVNSIFFTTIYYLISLILRKSICLTCIIYRTRIPPVKCNGILHKLKLIRALSFIMEQSIFLNCFKHYLWNNLLKNIIIY